MYLQKVVLVRLSTPQWDASKSSVPVGTEFMVQPSTLRIQNVWHEKERRPEKILCMQTDTGEWVPVEALHFTDEFQIR